MKSLSFILCLLMFSQFSFGRLPVKDSGEPTVKTALELAKDKIEKEGIATHDNCISLLKTFPSVTAATRAWFCGELFSRIDPDEVPYFEDEDVASVD